MQQKILKVLARVNLLFFIISYSFGLIIAIGSIVEKYDTYQSKKASINKIYTQIPTKYWKSPNIKIEIPPRDNSNKWLFVDNDGYLVAIHEDDVIAAFERGYSLPTTNEIVKYCDHLIEQKHKDLDNTIGIAIFAVGIGYPVGYILLMTILIWVFSGKYYYGKWYLK